MLFSHNNVGIWQWERNEGILASLWYKQLTKKSENKSDRGAHWRTGACKLLPSKFQWFRDRLAWGGQPVVFAEFKAEFDNQCFTDFMSYFLYAWLTHVVCMSEVIEESQEHKEILWRHEAHGRFSLLRKAILMSWVYLAKVKNFKDAKEIIAIAKTPGHRKNRKVIESLPLDWSIKVHSKPNLHQIG